ncbi:MAG: hypothetical protein AB1847_06355 [bacterium]
MEHKSVHLPGALKPFLFQDPGLDRNPVRTLYRVHGKVEIEIEERVRAVSSGSSNNLSGNPADCYEVQWRWKKGFRFGILSRQGLWPMRLEQRSGGVPHLDDLQVTYEKERAHLNIPGRDLCEWVTVPMGVMEPNLYAFSLQGFPFEKKEKVVFSELFHWPTVVKKYALYQGKVDLSTRLGTFACHLVEVGNRGLTRHLAPRVKFWFNIHSPHEMLRVEVPKGTFWESEVIEIMSGEVTGQSTRADNVYG